MTSEKPNSQQSLEQTTALYRLLGDATRVRLLALLEQQELTVAELVQITQLAQSRVSTHLAKLKEAGLLRDRRAGVSAYYAWNSVRAPAELASIWTTLRTTVTDTVLEQDQRRLQQLLDARDSGQSWADSVAGEMERHYSPGRSFESTARGLLQLLSLGNVVDIGSGDGAIAELLAPRAEQVICVDLSDKVIAAAQQRLKNYSNIRYEVGDMQAIPLADDCADQVLLLHTITWADQPKQVAMETARLLKPGGQLLVSTLHEHNHRDAVAEYGHRNLGFSVQGLTELFEAAGLAVNSCEITLRETRAPHFEVVTLLAHKALVN